MGVWAPKIIYPTGGGTTLTLELPQGYWQPRNRTVGGKDVAASGIPAGYLVRTDRTLEVTLRFWEREWPDVEAFLDWALSNLSTGFDFYPDETAGTNYTCYLVDPAPGGEFGPKRADFDSAVYELPIVIRTTDGSDFDVRAFGNV